MASKLELDLMPDHKIVVTIQCDNAYEAAVMYEDMAESARDGGLVLSFKTANPRVVIDRTRHS